MAGLSSAGARPRHRGGVQRHQLAIGRWWRKARLPPAAPGRRPTAAALVEAGRQVGLTTARAVGRVAVTAVPGVHGEDPAAGHDRRRGDAVLAAGALRRSAVPTRPVAARPTARHGASGGGRCRRAASSRPPVSLRPEQADRQALISPGAAGAVGAGFALDRQACGSGASIPEAFALDRITSFSRRRRAAPGQPHAGHQLCRSPFAPLHACHLKGPFPSSPIRRLSRPWLWLRGRRAAKRRHHLPARARSELRAS
jgi:hypothetical protein